jgi:hypothetical protein
MRQMSAFVAAATPVGKSNFAADLRHAPSPDHVRAGPVRRASVLCLALQQGDAIVGFQRESNENPAYREGLRWQFEVETTEQIDSIISVCRVNALEHEVVTERGGTRFVTSIVKVRSPSGHLIWFEGPNESFS